MKFSDMMGKGKGTVDEADAETEAVAARLKAPPVPEAPIRFGAPPEVATKAPVVPDTQPAIAEVMAELAPRKPEANVASNQQLDATAWLEGLATIDDDLLPT
jgi:hypothetical protein